MADHPRQEAVGEHLAEKLHRAIVNALRDDHDATPEFCAALDLLAEAKHQNKFRHAASILRGTVLGRTAIDDEEALRRIADSNPARRREAVGGGAVQMA